MDTEKNKRKNSASLTQSEFVVLWVVWQFFVGIIAGIVLFILLGLLWLQLRQEPIFYDGFHLQWILPASVVFAATLAQYPTWRKYNFLTFHRWFLSHALAYLITLACQFYLVFYDNTFMDFLWTNSSNFFNAFTVTVAPYVILHSLIVWWGISPDRQIRVIGYAGINILALLLTLACAFSISSWIYFCLIPVFFLAIQGIIMWWIVDSPTTYSLSETEVH